MMYKVEESTGDHLENVRRAVCSFNSSNLFDCGYLTDVNVVYGDKNVDSWDAYGAVDLDQCCQSLSVGKGYNCNFCFYCEAVRDCEYCFQVFNSKNCFGCIGVNHGEHMILNKKYEPAEWEKRVAEIKGQMLKDGEYGEWPVPEGEMFDG